jgi:hypothetical protein
VPAWNAVEAIQEEFKSDWNFPSFFILVQACECDWLEGWMLLSHFGSLQVYGSEIGKSPPSRQKEIQIKEACQYQPC